MQRKALKQMGKVTQWTNEKVFSGEKTQLSSDFTESEREIDLKRKGIERLHATSQPFFQQLTKLKATADPYPPPGSGKDKILYTEALGLVMIDYGGDLKNAYGDGLTKYGRARCKLAMVQEEYGNRLREGYIAGMESSLEAVNEYKVFRKKLDSRRLALDAAITKLNGAKKDHDKLEFEVQNSRERFEEIEEETAARMEVIQAGEEAEFEGLADLLDAELAYYTQCKEILEDLKESWPTGGVSAPMGRPRSGTTASSRSIKQPRRSFPASSDEENTPNRSRSHSNASGSGRTKEKRSMLPSFGSFGKKAGSSLGGIASMGSAKRKDKERRGFGEDERAALHSEEEEDNDYRSPQLSPRNAFASAGRTRSTSTLSTLHYPITEEADSFSTAPPVMKRTYTSPAHPGAKFVKALYEFVGEGHDELSLRPGMIVEVKQEVSADWWIGESGGRSGMFPSSYTEEYVPSPQTAVPPPMPRRSMPPDAASGSNGGLDDIVSRSTPPPQRAAYRPPSPVLDYGLTSDSELSHGYDDADHYVTASLATGGQQPAAQSRSLAAPSMSSTPSSSGKKAPPPPPPASRRSQSSTNVLTLGSNGPPPPPASRSRASTITRQQLRTESSPEGSPFGGPSPFGHSEDEESDAPSVSSSRNDRPIAGGRGLSSGLGAMHLNQNGQDTEVLAAKDCGLCDCRDFTQNVFKPKGTCSTCFHQH